MNKEYCKCGAEIASPSEAKKALLEEKMRMFETMLGKKVSFVVTGCPSCMPLEGVKNQEDFNNKFPNL